MCKDYITMVRESITSKIKRLQEIDVWKLSVPEMKDLYLKYSGYSIFSLDMSDDEIETIEDLLSDIELRATVLFFENVKSSGEMSRLK